MAALTDTRLTLAHIVRVNNGHNLMQLEPRCLFCNVSLADRKTGTKYCSDAHRKRYERMDEADRVYPKELAPGLRECRCNVHGKVFTEMWVQSLTIWSAVGRGCRQCAQLVAIRPLVEERMKDRRVELRQRVEAEMEHRDAELQQMIETALEGHRAEIERDMRLVLRGAIASDIEAEMEQEVIAELLEHTAVTA